MTDYIRYLKSDVYKLHHSCFFAVHILFAVLGAAMMFLYACISKSDDINKLAAYFQLMAVAFPFAISIVCYIAAEQEAKAGRFQNILTLPHINRAALSELTILLVSGLFAVALISVLFGVLFPLAGGTTKIPFRFYTEIPLILWGSNIFLYGIHFVLAFRFGKNVGIGFGVLGSLLSALLQTGLGTGIWFVIPYGWGVRFSSYALETAFGLLSPDRRGVNFGSIFCVLSTCAIIGCVIFWFSRYSGNRPDD